MSDDRTEDMRAVGFRRAEIVAHHGRVLVIGPPNSGITVHALNWAAALTDGGHIAVIDCEGNASAYAPTDDGGMEFWIHEWSGPYTPDRLVLRAEQAARAVGPDGCVVLDSLSMFWDGKGGIKDIVDAAADGWKIGGPVYRDMLDAITRLPCHVVVTCRAKTEWAIEQRERGDEMVAVARQVATSAEARSGVEFDFEVTVRLDADGYSTPQSFAPIYGGFENGTAYHPTRAMEAAHAYARYVNLGVRRMSDQQRTIINESFSIVTEASDRTRLKQRFVREVGDPVVLTADQFEFASQWIEYRAQAWLQGVDVDDDGCAPPVVEPEQETPPAVPELPEAQEVDDTGDGLHTKTFEELRMLCDALSIDMPYGGVIGRPELAALIREAMAAEGADGD